MISTCLPEEEVELKRQYRIALLLSFLMLITKSRTNTIIQFKVWNKSLLAFSFRLTTLENKTKFRSSWWIDVRPPQHTANEWKRSVLFNSTSFHGTKGRKKFFEVAVWQLKKNCVEINIAAQHANLKAIIYIQLWEYERGLSFLQILIFNQLNHDGLILQIYI